MDGEGHGRDGVRRKDRVRRGRKPVSTGLGVGSDPQTGGRELLGEEGTI